jgi:hypothetical protein
MTPPSELESSRRPLSIEKSAGSRLYCFLRGNTATWTAGRGYRTVWTPSSLDLFRCWRQRRAVQWFVRHDRAEKYFLYP